MTVELISFDGTQSCLSTVCAPDGSRSLRDELDGEGPWAVRGAGLSYAQASAASGARTVSSRRLDRFLTFDPERLRLTVEPGVTVGDLVRYSVAHDLMFPVLPGHPAITLGGCAGFNVHGKAPHEDGLFADHVVALTLLHPDHGELTCGRDQHPDVFELTLGGMGLTGFITSLTLQLRPLPGRSLRRTLHPVANLVEAAALMSSLRNGSEDGAAMYAWNDLNPTGDRFGRGTVYVESYEDARLPSRVKYRSLAPVRRWPLRLAGIRPVTLAVNLGYRRRDRCNALLDRGSLRAVEDGAFPINGNEVYYRLFGRNGFREYQMVVPTAAWPAAAADVRRAIQTAGVPISLGSLKLFAGDPRLLWFRADGVCLTIDAAEGQGTRALFDRLDRVAVEHGAPVNLSKDSRVSAEVVRSVYAGYGEFRARLHDFDPNRRFRSMLRQRIGV